MAKDIFLSHAWGLDELGRDNHLRVKNLYKLLTEKGYSVWFDENNMIGNIDNAIIKGISNTKVVILCLTETYCNKINKCVYENLPMDNCYKEWNFCLFKQKKIIPLIMEPKMQNVFLNNDGVIQMYLNNHMFINYSNINDDFNEINVLFKTLRYFEIYNNNEKKFLNIKPNNSFDKFLDMLQVSPKNKKELNIESKKKYFTNKHLFFFKNLFKNINDKPKIIKQKTTKPKTIKQKTIKQKTLSFKQYIKI